VTEPWPGLALVVGSVSGAALAAISTRVTPGRLMRTNHAGRKVPAVLGVALVGGTLLGTLAAAGSGDERIQPLPSGVLVDFVRQPVLGPFWIAVLVAAVGLTLVGLVDDLVGGRERGFREHLGSALRLRPTTGILKLGAGIAAAIVVAVLAGGGAVRVVATVVLIAACTNVWNALDVVPGRSLKWGTVVLLLALPRAWLGGGGEVPAAALGAAVAVLPFDLLERGMLGDAGSNPLGFLVGATLAVALPMPGVAVAAVAAVALQVAAETVTISRLIEATPPLRWFDRLGRRPEVG
jgi:UDP-N-acetylmuramyl pentapeptide phosphotransferase/UDP-N-acetylglucosamine-1-phosphate transferase